MVELAIIQTQSELTDAGEANTLSLPEAIIVLSIFGIHTKRTITTNCSIKEFSAQKETSLYYSAV